MTEPDRNRLRFRKSSYSGGGSNSCIELAAYEGGFAIRDSKDKAGPILSGISAADLRAFLADVKRDRL